MIEFDKDLNVILIEEKTKIGNKVILGAGSIVTKDIPANTVWYGNPAKQKGYITCDGILLDMEMKDKNGKQY